MTFCDSCALLSSKISQSTVKIFSILFRRKKFLCISAGRFHMDSRHEAKSAMEIVNVPPIVSIYRQALHTFDDKNKQDLPVNLTKLRSLMDGLRAEHLGFNKTFNDPSTWGKAGKAPCTYIEVFQNSKVNMSIFILRPGFQMPLHDHPHMHGMLKVISGAIQIRSFTEFPLTEVVKMVDFKVRVKLEAARLAQGLHKRRKLFAQISQNQVCRDNSTTCILTPTISNYHEIKALEMPAAFFDILSPPYDTLIEGIGPRRCRYYHVVNEISTNLVEMQETDVPECFYCDQAPYLGPILS